jgi:hypothetical protein
MQVCDWISNAFCLWYRARVVALAKIQHHSLFSLNRVPHKHFVYDTVLRNPHYERPKGLYNTGCLSMRLWRDKIIKRSLPNAKRSANWGAKSLHVIASRWVESPRAEGQKGRSARRIIKWQLQNQLRLGHNGQDCNPSVHAKRFHCRFPNVHYFLTCLWYPHDNLWSCDCKCLIVIS